MTNKEKFEKWWQENAMPHIIGDFEIRLYRGVTKETAEKIWQAAKKQDSRKIARLARDLEYYKDRY